MKDIFFFEAFEEEKRFLEEFEDTAINCAYSAGTVQESGIARPPARVVSIRTQSDIPGKWLEEVDGVLARATGYDHLARLEKVYPGVSYGYLPLYCSRSVAEQAMLLWMSLMRKLDIQQKQFQSFNRDGLTGSECSQKCLLVVGVGNIGYEVTRMGRALNMEVLGVDIVRKHEDVVYVSLEEGLRRADVIVCSMNLTEDNDRYFRYQVLQKAARRPFFVNIARGEFSPVEDIIRLLDEGKLAGAALDVYPDEKTLAGAFRTGAGAGIPAVENLYKLRERSNVILTPHNAFNTVESVRRKAKQSMEQVEHFFRTGKFKWPVPRGDDG